jgi:hypothetical protein
MLSIIPYIPTNRIRHRPMENDSGWVSTTSLNKTYTTAKASVDVMMIMKYRRKLGFIIFLLGFPMKVSKSCHGGYPLKRAGNELLIRDPSQRETT